MSEEKFQKRLQQFNHSFDTLFALLEDYPAERGEQPGACGEWSPKQVLAHLDGWLVEAMARYDAYDRGEQETWQYAIDDFNAQSVAARSARSWGEQIADLLATVDTITARASDVPVERRAVHSGYRTWLKVMAEDCDAHTVELREFLHNAEDA